MGAVDFGERNALLQEARRLRTARRVPEALDTLARLEGLHPEFSRLHQERGHCHVLLRNGPAAIAALREAVRLNATLPASWDMLEQLYRLSGDAVEASSAAQTLSILKQLPQEIVAANSLFADGDLESAEEIIRAYLHRDAGNVGALRLLARICVESERPEQAEPLLAAALEYAPDYHEARFDYVAVLLNRQKHLQARQEAGRLRAHDPLNRAYLKQYTAACIGLGDQEPVVDLCAALLEGEAPFGSEVADLRLWRANALKVGGRPLEAVADYHASLAARPDYGVAWFSLANLKTYRFSAEDIARMRSAEAAPDIQDLDRVYLCFALGKAFEDEGDYATSWRFYERGNAVRRRSANYRPDSVDACAGRMKQTFDAAFFADRAGWGVDDPAPVFILGLPRSGSTLIEQILASHSEVEGTQELLEIGRYAGEICGIDPDCALPLAPDAVQRLTKADVCVLGERFLSETRAYRRLGRPFFIDKMPNNFWHIGLIHLILPRATIIDVRREPMACGFSNLKQLFGTTHQEFAYGAEEIARYYRTYLDLMRHWNEMLPGRVLTVQYEDVVEDVEGSTRRMLAHLGLPFQSACVAFHENPRGVRTPSSEQVRRPINREGLDQWRNYAPWLDTLQSRLGEALTHYRT